MKTNIINIVIGANYGDEGKGLVTNEITPGDGLVVLTNGGAQRGHTAHYNGIRHVFHHFGSATLKGATSYAYDTFIVNPLEFKRELIELGKCGQSLSSPKLIVSPECRMTTVYDMMMNNIRTQEAGVTASTGFGVYETIIRYQSGSFKNVGQLVRDCDAWEEELAKVRDYYINKLEGMHASEMVIALFRDERLIDNFITDMFGFFNNIMGIGRAEDILPEFRVVTCEQGQGLALDNDYDVEFGTPTKTGSDIPAEIISKLPFKPDMINRYYVSRTYVTRHGHGELPDESKDLAYEDKTNVPNAHQGSIRFAPLSGINIMRMRARICDDMRKLKANDYLIFTHANIETPNVECFRHVELKGVYSSMSELGNLRKIA